MSELETSKCRFSEKGCNSHILCVADDDSFDDCCYKAFLQSKELCKQIEESNKILYEEKCRLLEEIDELRKNLRTSCKYYAPGGECALTGENCYGTSNCIDKYKQCLDEIEEIVKDGDICCNDCRRLILQQIKEVKK